MKPAMRWCVSMAAWALAGCASEHAVLATTATTIGVELGTNTATGTPSGVLGYRRAEFAYVPTARTKNGTTSNGAQPDLSRVADVLMELSYGGVLSNNGNIHQRLAVGANAVNGPGAAVLFARNNDGKLDEAAAAAAVAAGKSTLTQADKLLACTTRSGVLVPAAMAKIVDRAEKDTTTAAYVKDYKSALTVPLPTAALRTLLTQSGTLTSALAKHQSEADCAAS